MRIEIKKTVIALIAVNLVASAFAQDTSQPQAPAGAEQQTQKLSPPEADSGTAVKEHEAATVEEPAGAQPDKAKAKIFLKKAAAEEKLEIALTELAKLKAENQQVKQFAQKLGESQQQSAQRLQQIAQMKGVSVEIPQFQQMVSATGQQFDRSYLTFITQEGREALQYMQKVAKQHPDPRVQQFAQKQLADLRQYLQQAQRAQTELQASGEIQEPAGAQGQQGSQQLQELQQQVQQLQQQVQQLQQNQQSGQWESGQTEMPDAREFVKIAAAHCKMGIVLNQLAAEKAQSQQVRQLVQQQKQSMQQKGQQLRELAQQHGVQVDPEKVQKLADARARQFDQNYIRFITEQHREAVQDWERVANESQDEQIQQYARQRLPEIRQRLEEAQRLQTQIQASGGAIQEPAGAEQSQDQKLQQQEQPQQQND